MTSVFEFGETGNDIAVGYGRLLRSILHDGESVSPRGLATIELRNTVIDFPDARECLLIGIGRGLSTKLAALEALQLIGGWSHPDLVVKVAPQYAAFMDDGKFHGAYGQRTAYKPGLVADRLRTDPRSRQANMQYWSDARDLAMDGKHDYPCTLHSNFSLRLDENGMERLLTTTVMRSNDVWLGFPYDIVQFSALHRSMARFLNVNPGTYSHIVHSMHAYTRDLPGIIRLEDQLYGRTAGEEFRQQEHEWVNLEGGVGTGKEEQWADICKRTKTIAFQPKTVEAASPEEEWLLRQAYDWQDLL